MAERIAIASVVATLAFWAYTQTLLPGVDLGDTGGFQAAVLWPEVSARQAYPLYYALARPFVLATSPGNPARALNLFSAIWAAAAVGLLTFVCASVTQSRAGGVVAGVLLAFSYTFWTQAIIAEVYSLHLALIGTSLLALHAYATRPNTWSLLVFLGVYAASFGNHLGMILMFVPFALFLILAHPAPHELFRARIVLATLTIVIAAALEYAPNFIAVWRSLDAPATWNDRAAAFWFDVTKQDWRETMVLGISADRIGDRLAMSWFDARQQFGVLGLGLALVGAVGLWRISRPWAVLALTAYGAVTAFAFTYNVGDSHVFFLPGHYITAFCAGAGVAFLMRRWRGTDAGRPDARVGRALSAFAKSGRCATRRSSAVRRSAWRTALAGHRSFSGDRLDPAMVTKSAVIVAVLAYVSWRAWSTWPVVDRHDDHRGEALIARLAQGVDQSNALLVSQMNWQLENVLLYTGRYARPGLTWVRLGDVMAHWPFIVEDNHRLGRDVVMNGAAAAEVVAAYGPEFPLVEDIAVMRLPEAFAAVPRGSPYVLSVLTPLSENPLDAAELGDALGALTDGNAPSRVPAAYEIIAGVAGERPQAYRASNHPFTESFRIADEPFTVRMDSWLPFDTFRRAGFGHVLRGREHVLTVERGLSLVWVARDGRPSRPYYAASLFADEPRYRVPAATLELARKSSIRPQHAPRAGAADWREP